MRTNSRSLVSIAWLVVFVLTGFYGLTGSVRAQTDANSISWELKLDAEARLLLSSFENPVSERIVSLYDFISFYHDEDADEWLVDVFVLLDDPANAPLLDELGVERRTQVKDIVVARLPVESLFLLAQEPYVRCVQTGTIQALHMDSSRPEIRAGQVHQGTNLPQSYDGNNVVVGIVDSGIDFTHADFSDSNGTRIQYLLEYTRGGGQNEWTKSQIDTNPGSVTQRGTGAGGHGTHVAGTAVGGGKVNPVYRGIAPGADIIFVKAILGTTDISVACDNIFKKAQTLGKPMVINLSLGSHNSPHDGSSLYEQNLSNLTGPGKIIVASAGNEGWVSSYSAIHAGGTVVPNTTYGSLLAAAQPSQAMVNMWYDQAVISDVNVVAYNSQLIEQASTGWFPVGQRTVPPPILRDSNGTALGDVYIDAMTTYDTNNGDGRILFWITNINNPAIDIRRTYWLVTFRTQAPGEVHMWTLLNNDAFSSYQYNFQGITDMPGNNDYTIATPATAYKVISVGSYATKNSWVDLNGITRPWLDASGAQTLIGQHSLFSSLGPTRDKRIAPDLCAPGEVIVSALSSHLSPVEYSQALIIQGGGYQLMQGTSMSAPHITGVVALMLQVYPSLDYDQVVNILRSTTRSDGFTGGSLPDNMFGAGKVDALAAVQAADATGQSIVTFIDPNLQAAVESALGVTNPTFNDVLNLSTLYASNQGITDLTGLEYATNLTELWLSSNQITDISPLSGLTQLSRLFLSFNQISDVSPLKNLNRLTLLELSVNRITDLSPLSGLTTLDVLRLGSNQITDINDLSGLTQLTSLSLYDNRDVRDLSPLSNMTQLVGLVIHSNKITDLSPLSGLTQLTLLDSHDNQITDLTPLAGMTNLSDMYLHKNQISDLAALLNLRRLNLLDVQNNPLSAIALNQQIPQITANNPGATILY